MLLAALGNASRGGEHGPRIFFPLLLLLLLGFLIGKVVRHRRGGGHAHGYRHGSPLQALEHRFARGEIDQAEFDHRKAVLNGADDVPPPPASAAPPQPAPEAAEPAVDADSGPDAGDEA